MDSHADSGDDEAADIAVLLDPGAEPIQKQSAFERLHARYSRELLSLLRSQVGHDPMRDVEQTVWLRVLENIAKRFEKGTNFRAWLYRIARNEAINYHRSNKKASTVQLPVSIPDHRALPEEDDERRRVLDQCMERLDPRSREVIRARQRMSSTETNDEIAKRFGMTTARLYGLVSETIAQLKKCVKEKKS